MTDFTREQLHAYLDECLPDAETARIEQALRESDTLRQRLRLDRNRGEHSLGTIRQHERSSIHSGGPYQQGTRQQRSLPQ